MFACIEAEKIFFMYAVGCRKALKLAVKWVYSVDDTMCYVVKTGDTLWNLVKNFNTIVDDIVKINAIENPDLIYSGQKLLILKKVW